MKLLQINQKCQLKDYNMKIFNINDYIYIQITEAGWNHLRATVGEEYIKHCIDNEHYRVEIDGEVWHRLQAHEVFELLPCNFECKTNYNTNIMIEDKYLN